MTNRAFHDAANIFPLMSEHELAGLAEDIKTNGLRQPIWTEQGTGLIVDGRNRFLACEIAGVRPVFRDWDGDDLLAFVLSENLHRRHLNESQRAMVAVEIERYEAIEAKTRQGSRTDIVANLPQCGKARDKAARAVGVSGRGVSSAKVVRRDGTKKLIDSINAGIVAVSFAEQLSKTAPEFQDSVVSRILSGQKPREALRVEKSERLIEKGATAAPSGKYRVIYADPPWRYSDSRAGVEGFEATAADDHYPTMATDDICDLPVADMADPDAVLFCWATFPLLPDAMRVVDAWGFKYKTAVVWDKGRPNFGHYHRADAELLLIATKGSCTPDAKERISQVQRVERTGRHSAKPEHFRKMIDGLYIFGGKIEMFRRGDAPEGWKVWGNEAA